MVAFSIQLTVAGMEEYPYKASVENCHGDIKQLVIIAQ